MSCVVVGPSEEAGRLGLPGDMPVVPPEQFQDMLRHMTRVVVVGPRLLNDRDMRMVNQVPAALVLTNPTDVVHIEMHIRAGRLHLTPSDVIVIRGPLLEHRFFAPWIDLLRLEQEGLSEFVARTTTEAWHPVPAGFETIPKLILSGLAAEMRNLRLAQYSCVVGSSAGCRSLTGVLCDLSNLVLAEIEGLPPDVICAEPAVVADQLAAQPEARMLICPVIVDKDNPVEVVHLTVTTAAGAPVNLVQAVPGPRPADGRLLTGLVYAVG